MRAGILSLDCFNASGGAPDCCSLVDPDRVHGDGRALCRRNEVTAVSASHLSLSSQALPRITSLLAVFALVGCARLAEEPAAEPTPLAQAGERLEAAEKGAGEKEARPAQPKTCRAKR